MRFYVKNKDNERCLKVSERLIDILVNEGHTLDEYNPEFVFSIGGDGTFLKAVHAYLNIDPIFIGINEGNLGFLCEFTLGDFNIIKNIINDYQDNYKNYSLLGLEVNNETYYSLNEVRIESNDGSSLRFDISVNDDFLERLNADGVCISSSIGSSGINKGLGGALVSHNLEIMQLIEKTPINNRCYSSINSPIIFNKDDIITIDNFAYNKFSIYYDNQSYNLNNFNGTIKIYISDKKIRVLKHPNITFTNKVNDAFIK